MKKVLLITLLLAAQSFYAQITFSTGNTELDNHLKNINDKAKENIDQFKEDVKKAYNLPKEKIEEFMEIMEPAEVVLSGDIAKIAKKPIDTVVKTYQTNKEAGWGEVSKKLGIKPGSKEFHELKATMKNKADKGNKGQSKGKSKGKGQGKGNGKGGGKGKK